MVSSEFRDWFNCSDHADVLLLVRSEQAPALQPKAARTRGAGSKRKKPRTALQTEEPEAPDVRTYHAHAMHLSAQSGWFKAALSQPWKGSSSESSDRCHELTVHLQPDEMEAMDLLLRLLYGHDLPAVAQGTIPLLFKSLKLADQFASSACVDLLLGHLKDIPIDSLALRFACEMPPGVAVKPAYKQLLGSCRTFVLQRYGNVTTVIKGAQLRQEFCSLPFAAVLAWVESDELQVQSENCVVYLLSAWVKAAQGEQGEGVSDEQLEQLAHQVRVLHLGPAYQHHILPQLEWFNGCSGMAWLPSLLAFKERDRTGRAVFMPTCSGRWYWEGPKQWLATPRKQCAITDADTLLALEVGGERLRKLLHHQGSDTPATLYLCGFHLSVKAVVLPGFGANGGMTLALLTGAKASCAEGCNIPWPPSAAVVVGPAECRVMGPRTVVRAQGRPVALFGDRFVCAAFNVLPKSAPTASELLAPYLCEGKLRLQVKFSHVDQP